MLRLSAWRRLSSLVHAMLIAVDPGGFSSGNCRNDVTILTPGGSQSWNIAWLVRRPQAPEQSLISETDRDDPSEQLLEHNVTRDDDSAALVCRARTTTGERLAAEISLRVTCGCCQ